MARKKNGAAQVQEQEDRLRRQGLLRERQHELGLLGLGLQRLQRLLRVPTEEETGPQEEEQEQKHRENRQIQDQEEEYVTPCERYIVELRLQ